MALTPQPSVHSAATATSARRSGAGEYHQLSDGDLIEAGGTLLMFREEAGEADGATDRDLATETATPIVFRTVNLELEHRMYSR